MIPSVTDNELDLRQFCYRLWRGKMWIVALTLAGILLAWGYSQLAPQKWVAVAVVDRPSRPMFSQYYQSLQQLQQLSTGVPVLPANTGSDEPGSNLIANNLYHEFILQLSSWDNRRAFWLQSDYWQKLPDQSPAYLQYLINAIQFMPRDDARGTQDTLRLQSDSARHSRELLDAYIRFTGQQTQNSLNADLQSAWQSEIVKQAQQQEYQLAIARRAFGHKRQQLESALKMGSDAKNHAELKNLLAKGPEQSDDLVQAQIRLKMLQQGQGQQLSFQTWRYLQTPELPVTRDSPRQLLLCIMWGSIGAIIGGGVALFRLPGRKGPAA